MQVLGTVVAEFDGKVISIDDEQITIQPGGKIATTQMGQNGVNGHHYRHEPGRVELGRTIAKGDSIKELLGRSGTLVVRADSGQVWNFTNMALVEMPSVTSAGGKQSYVFEGDAAEETL